MNLSQLLKGCELLKEDGRVVVQTIRNMQVAFLTTAPENSFDARFANPLTTLRFSNRNYGHLRAENQTDQDVILAPQFAVMTKYAAQNHALPKSAYVPAGQAVDYNDAGCVQGSQAGTIRAGDGNEVRFMPVTIREMLLDEANNTHSGLAHLYTSVETLGIRTRSNSGRYLDRYYDEHNARLQEFVAHFERPKNLIGVVILVGGEIVAIDKFPSFNYTEQVWDLLVRDCYGSIAIEQMVKNESGKPLFTERLESSERAANEDVVAYLSRVLDGTLSDVSETVMRRLQEVMLVDFDAEQDVNSISPIYESNILKSDGYVGQVISSGGAHLLVSVIKKDRFDPVSIRKTYEEVEAYRSAAENQRAFTL